MKRSPLRALGSIFALFILLPACGPSGPTISNTSFEGSNVLLVVVDSLRADHVGAYGYDKPTTPFIDELAAEGLVFERAYANSSYVSQSISALLTGRLPTSGGSIGMTEAEPDQSLTTLPQMFRAAGYQTGIATNQPLLRNAGFTKGFLGVQIDTIPPEWDAQDVSQRALTFAEDVGDDPFFLYVHYADPQHPYDPPEQFLDKFVEGPAEDRLDVAYFQEHYKKLSENKDLDADPRFRDFVARYDAEVAAVDAAVHALVDGLAEQGKLQNTVIVFTGSHGEEFLDHGYVQHAWTLYDEVIRVPLIVSARDQFTPLRVSDTISHVDLYPSFAALLNLPNDRNDLEGHALFQTSGDETTYVPHTEPVLAELIIRERAMIRAVIDDGWKYIAEYKFVAPDQRAAVASAYLELATAFAEGKRTPPPLWTETVREELYSLPDDPSEETNVIDNAPGQANVLRRVLARYESFCAEHALTPAEPVGKGPDLDPAQLKHMKDLGYL